MKPLVDDALSRAHTLKELLLYLWENRLWWIIPFVVVLVLVGTLIIVAETSPVAPFMYALF